MPNQGGKARGLEELVQFGHVPEWIAVDPAMHELVLQQEQIAQLCSVLTKKRRLNLNDKAYPVRQLPAAFTPIIQQIPRKFAGKRIIARSCSRYEDGVHSFAGVYGSRVVSELTVDGVTAALLQVYASFNSDKAVAYRARNNTPDDKMGIIVQEYIDGDHWGVMHTSVEGAPHTLSITLSAKPEAVTSGNQKPFGVEYDKKSGRFTYREHGLEARSSALDQLFSIGKEVEGEHGPSAIEFVIDDDTAYPLQRRNLKGDFSEAPVRYPHPSGSVLIGSTRFRRGNNTHTLPAVCWDDPSLRLKEDGKYILLLGSKYARKASEENRLCYANLIQLDKMFQGGYALVTPHILSQCELPGMDPTLTVNDLTPAKRAIVASLGEANPCCHEMDIAREQGIIFVSLDPGKLLGVSTGDILTINFCRDKADVYVRNGPAKSIKARYPELQYAINETEGGLLEVQVSQSILDSKSHLLDMLFFLQEHRNTRWRLTAYGTRGVFADSCGRSFVMDMHGSRAGARWKYAPDLLGKRSIPDQELKEIARDHIAYLQGDASAVKEAK